MYDTCNFVTWKRTWMTPGICIVLQEVAEFVWYSYRYSIADHANLENILFQATINLHIGYEPPANTTPNLNDQPGTDVSHVDAGKFLWT